MRLIFVSIVLLVFGHEQVPVTALTFGQEMIKVYGECAKSKLNMENYLLLLVGVDLDDVAEDTVIGVQDCLRMKNYPFFNDMADWGPDDFEVGDECFLDLATKSKYQKIKAKELDTCFEQVKKARLDHHDDE